MLYVVFSEDVDNSLPLRMEARSAHLSRLRQLQDEAGWCKL